MTRGKKNKDTREFVYLYTRHLSIMNVEEWFLAETKFLKKFFPSRGVSYGHFFLHKNGEGVRVFYEKRFLDAGRKKIIDILGKHPEKFKVLFTEYSEEREKILALEKSASFKDFSVLLYMCIEKVWPLVTISVVLGEAPPEFHIPDARKIALSFRKKCGEDLYIVGNKLWELVSEKYADLPKEYLDFLSIEEIVSRNIPSMNVLNERRERYAFFNGNIFVGDKIQSVLKREGIVFIEHSGDHSIREVSGTIAMMGKVRGRVRIVIEYADMSKFKDGEILVSSMTVPDFLPAMKKAAAFVTDEGGITCHAAIVAREMEKPCIIGTKIATKVFKDGDLVEVDANKGIVRVLKRK
ncbi:hypothetical protein HY483_01940 [Candidatus Woesearchaeota archaeon]|nr:hypothetical protein [Candidatus Woesearchaeota archaeon]